MSDKKTKQQKQQKQEEPNMETISCMVALDENTDNQVLKHNITVPEAVILKVIHGSACLLDIVLTKKVFVTDMGEKARLVGRYQKAVKKPVEDSFPGHSPVLPKKFADIGITPALAPKVKRESGNVTAVDGNPAEISEEETQKIIEDNKKSSTSASALKS